MLLVFFIFIIDESVKEKMMVFKENYQSNSIDYIKELRDILRYLR